MIIATHDIPDAQAPVHIAAGDWCSRAARRSDWSHSSAIATSSVKTLSGTVHGISHDP